MVYRSSLCSALFQPILVLANPFIHSHIELLMVCLIDCLTDWLIDSPPQNIYYSGSQGWFMPLAVFPNSWVLTLSLMNIHPQPPFPDQTNQEHNHCTRNFRCWVIQKRGIVGEGSVDVRNISNIRAPYLKVVIVENLKKWSMQYINAGYIHVKSIKTVLFFHMNRK